MIFHLSVPSQGSKSEKTMEHEVGKERHQASRRYMTKLATRNAASAQVFGQLMETIGETQSILEFVREGKDERFLSFLSCPLSQIGQSSLKLTSVSF